MSEPERWRFGPYAADRREHQLLRDGRAVPVTRKAFALLCLLLQRAPRLATKAELFDIVWAGTVVTDAALSRAIRELRVALGDEAGAPHYIATVHGVGFRFIAEVQADVAPAPPAAPAAAGGPTAAAAASLPRTFGREAELQALRAALADAQAGQRRIVFVTGVAGIGKSALLEGFVQAEAAGRAWVGLGRCIETYGTGEPYLPLLEAFETLARQVGTAALAALLLRHAPAWLAQLPWLAREADAQVLQQALVGATPQRMLREAAAALEALADERPLLLWLEDLHWSDPSTLELLAWLAGRRQSSRLLVLASCRPAEAQPDAAPLRSLLPQLLQRGQAVELALAPLDEAAVHAWLARRVPPAPDMPLAALAAFVHRRTDGLALFATAVLDDLVRRGQLRPGAAGWGLAVPVDELATGLPDSLRQLVQQQIAQLTEPDRRLIEAAAVVGAEFDAASLAAALRAEVADVEERTLRLLQRGSLLRHAPAVHWPDGTEAAGFGFRHALYWQGVFESVAPARRAEWQLRAAQRIEQAWGDGAGRIAAELAMRFEAARVPARALHYLRLAGTAALRRFAYREGVEHLQHALSLLPAQPGPEREGAERELLLMLGAAQIAAQGYGSPDVEATYQRALALCRRGGHGGELLRALRGLWNVALVRAELDKAQLAADELVLQAAAYADPSAAFDAFAKLGQTAMHRGDFAAARRHLEHALALPLPADDGFRQREAPRVLAYLAWVLWYGGEAPAALARGDEALAAARAAGAHTLAFVLGFVGWLHVFRGEPQRLPPLALEQSALAEEHGLPYWGVWSRSLLALAQALCAAAPGEAAAGRQAMAAALDGFALQGAAVGVSQFRCTLAEAALEAGDLDAARAACAASAALLDRTGNAYHAADTLRLQGELALADGDAAAARHWFEAALRRARLQGAHALAQRAQASLAALPARAARAAGAAGRR